VYRHGLNLRTGSLVFVPLVFLSVAVGVWFPLDLHALFGLDAAVARRAWVWALMVYAAAASILPVWLLLQPRDYLNAYLLYAMMAFGVLGILVFRPGIELPAFAGWSAVGFGGRSTPIFPLLFVTVACGACSGFHSLVASGTTSKQLDREKDALPIGYGGMLIEGVLGFVALITVAYLSREQLGEQLAAAKGAAPVLFARGLATFGERLGVPPEIGMTFVSLSVSAFLMTTLDTATRLARFTLQELAQPMGGAGGDELSVPRQVFANKHAATAVVVLASAWLAFTDAQRIWPVFGASNQLLAALALLVATLWLIRHQARRAWVTFFPMIFMLAVSGTGLAQLARRELYAAGGKGNAALGVIAAGLVVLSVLLVVLAARSVRRELRART
jgi:carbon starvation protein